MTKPLIDQAVDRFLGWKLPQDFNPDGRISFMIPINATWFHTGTNLLHAGQAKEMLEHVAAPLFAQVARLENEKHDLETTLHRVFSIAEKAGYQNNGALLSDWLESHLNPQA